MSHFMTSGTLKHNPSEKWNHRVFFTDNNLLMVVKCDDNFNQCDSLGFVIVIESVTNSRVNVGLLMLLGTGQSRAIYVNCGEFGVNARNKLLALVFALRQRPTSISAFSFLLLISMLLSATPVRAQIVNSDFSGGATGWTSTIPGGSSLAYTGNQLTTVSDNDGGANSRTYAAQSLTNTDPGFLTWLLRSYTSVDTDLGVYDYPMVLVGTTFSYVNTAGGIQATNTGAAVDNDNTGITNLTVRTTLAAAGTRNIGAGVTSTDSCCGAGTAIWDDIVFQEFTQSPAAQVTPFNTVLNLSGANRLQIATNSGVTAATVTVALSVTNGTLTLGSTTGLTFGPGSNGASSFTVTGTVANINAALTRFPTRQQPAFPAPPVLHSRQTSAVETLIPIQLESRFRRQPLRSQLQRPRRPPASPMPEPLSPIL